jgi:hypothetical protein
MCEREKVGEKKNWRCEGLLAQQKKMLKAVKMASHRIFPIAIERTTVGRNGLMHGFPAFCLLSLSPV